MDFIFRPLSAGAVSLRKQAQRLALTLQGAKGVANRIDGEYLLRAVGDGKTVVVTALPLPQVIGGVYNAFEADGLYPATAVIRYKQVTFATFVGAGIESAVNGADSNLAGTADYRRYVASGRVQIGTVSQLWPLGFIGDVDDGWLRSPPEFTVQGQCRLSHEGAVDSDPRACHEVPTRSAILTLHTPVYREAYFIGLDVSAIEHAVTLFRLNGGTRMVKWADISPDYPEAIKTDVQADYNPRVGSGRGRSLIEISTADFGVDLTFTGGTPFATEGALMPLGCFEWSFSDGCVAITVNDRNGVPRISMLRYTITSDAAGTAVWQKTLTAVPIPLIADQVVQSVADGMWATRAGRGLSDGTPEQPDAIVLLTTEVAFTDADPGAGTDFEPTVSTRLWRVDPVTTAATSVLLERFDRSYANTAGGLTEYAYAHALGVTVGTGAAELPVLVCCRRTIPYWLQTVESVTTRIPQAFDRTGADETHLVAIAYSGAITLLDTGTNFPAYYYSSSDVAPSLGDGVNRRLGFACLRDVPATRSMAVYAAPVCEYALGYIAALVVPRAQFTATDWPVRLVICNVSTGALVYESAALPLAPMQVSSFVGISCSTHGVVTVDPDTLEEVATGGTLLITLRRASLFDTESGCFATRDLGVTLNRVLSPDVPGATMHYLGSQVSPRVIGGGL